jgi:Right handed beta helix region
LDGSGNTIQYNTIHDVGRQAILLNGPLNQDISYNNLYNAMLLSRDGGQIYACCNQTASGTRIHHNWIHDTAPEFEFGASSLAMSGIVIDNNSSGFEIDQNVLWNNSRSNLLINGLGSAQMNNNFVHNNSVPDDSGKGRMWVTTGAVCATRIIDNRVLVHVGQQINGSPCIVYDNNSHAAGATDMKPTSQVGCNFDGCSSSPPPAILDDGSFYPCPYLGSAGSGLTAQACIEPLVFASPLYR